MKTAVPLAKNILAPLGITAAGSVIDSRIKKKKNTCFWNYNTNNIKKRTKWHNENCSGSWRF